MFENCSITDWLLIIGGTIIVCVIILSVVFGGAAIFKLGVNWIIGSTEGEGKGIDGRRQP